MVEGPRFKLVRDLFALSGGQALSKLLAFLGFAYLARTLDPASYGAVEYAVGLSLVFAIAVEWGTGPLGVRTLARSAERAPELAARISGARLALACLAVPVMGLSTHAAGREGPAARLVWLFALGLLALPWKHDWLFQGLERMSAAAGAVVLRTAAFAGAAVMLVRDSRDLLMVGWAELAAAALATVYYVVLRRRWVAPAPARPDPAELRALLGEGFAIGLTTLIWGLIQFLPLFLVAHLASGTDTAWLGASQRIAVSLLTFSHVYHFNLYPALARRIASAPDDFRRLIGASYRVTAWAGILAALLLTLLARPLLILVYGDAFAAAGPTLSILLWTLPATLLSGHARWALIASGHQRDVLVAHVVGAAAALAVGLVAVPRWGAAGGALAHLAATLTVWATAQVAARLRLGPLALAAVLGPGAAAALAFFVARALEAGPWLATAVAAPLFLLAALLLDRRVLDDLRRLALAKAEARAAEAGPAPSTRPGEPPG